VPRSPGLEIAILGLLQERPQHGYELRKRLDGLLGPFRAISYGSLYPELRRLVNAGLLTTADQAQAGPPHTRRARITYELTEAGSERLLGLLDDGESEEWDDDLFRIRVAMLSRTSRQLRLRILNGRRERLRRRLAVLERAPERPLDDPYATALQQHTLASVKQEVHWLDTLITAEGTT